MCLADPFSKLKWQRLYVTDEDEGMDMDKIYLSDWTEIPLDCTIPFGPIAAFQVKINFTASALETLKTFYVYEEEDEG